MPPKLRYEVYLPTLYNDKTPVEYDKYRKVKNIIQKRFGGLSIHPASIEGLWVNPNDKELCDDNLFKYEIVVEKTQENKEFFEKYKEELKALFKQHEIFMVFTEVNWV